MFFTLLFPSSFALSPNAGTPAITVTSPPILSDGGPTGGVAPGGEVTGPETFNVTLTGTYRNLDLWQHMLGEFGAGISSFSIFNIEFDSGCLIGSWLGAGSYALKTGSFPATATVTITNNGTIIGGGGRGGDWGFVGGDGEDGGNGISFGTDMSFVNNGRVAGGGGGGGGGTNSFRWKDNLIYWAVGGGGAGDKGGESGMDPEDKRVPEWTGTRDNGARVPTASDAGDGGNPDTAGGAGTGSGGGDPGDAVHKNGKTVTISGTAAITGVVSATT